MTQSEESITLMTAYRLPHHSNRFFAALRMTSYGLPYHGHRPSHLLLMTPCRPVSFCTVQKYFVRKQESGNVKRSEEFITSADVLPIFAPWQRILCAFLG